MKIIETICGPTLNLRIQRCCEILLIASVLCLDISAQEAKSQSTAGGAGESLHIDEQSRPAVDRLRAVAQAIKACPSTESSRADGVLTTGPALDVIWDVVPAKVRAPYAGYIEFTLPNVFSPSSPNAKCEVSNAGCSQSLINGIYVTTITKPWRYRYEFDVGPNGLELLTVLGRPDYGGGEDWATSWLGNGCESKLLEAATAAFAPVNNDSRLPKD